jgi:hypothetical protein
VLSDKGARLHSGANVVFFVLPRVCVYSNVSILVALISSRVCDLFEVAFGAAGLDWPKYVEIDPKLIRPAEVDSLFGNATQAREVLRCKPQVGFEDLIGKMVSADLEALRKSTTHSPASS